MIRTLKLTFALAMGLLLGAVSDVHAIVLNFSSSAGSPGSPGGMIEFNGTGDTFQFIDAPSTGRDIRITTVQGSVGDSVGLLGNLSGVFTIGAISSFGSLQTAPVTGVGGFAIYDGSTFLTATASWNYIATVGATGSLNAEAALNLSNISYSGTNADLLQLATAVSQQGTATVTFQFSSSKSLTQLTTNGAINTASYSGTLSVVEAAKLSGYVYEDVGNDGIRNSEPGISGVTVTLTGTDDLGNAVNLNAITNGSGYYEFTNLRPGTYTVTEAQPGAYYDGKDTPGSTGGSNAVNDVLSGIVLVAGANSVENNFGELPSASLSGYVYVDANDDGIFQGTEAPIPGVTVTLTGTDIYGNPVNVVAVTGPTGLYSFPNLAPSNGAGYTITETQPGGYFDGKDTIGTPGGTTGNDVFSAVVLNPGVNGVNNNFGELEPAHLGDYVWLDQNRNGQQEGSEPVISGVTVNLLDSTGTTVLQTTTTNGGGLYSFTVAPGTYVVQFVTPAGAYDKFTTANSGNDATDSDAGANGKTGAYTVASGETNNTIDAGLLPIDLELTKSVDNPTPLLGTNVVFTVTITNNNAAPGVSAATGVLVADVLPAGLTYVSDDGGGSYAGGVWNVGTLAPGASKVLHITATVTTGGTKTNYTQVTAAGQLDVDSQPNNNPGPVPNQDDEAAVSLTSPARIGDYVWLDLNRNGQQDGGEPVISGVTVELLDASGTTVLGTTTTNGSGLYSFTVAPGTYVVRFVEPAGGYDKFTTANSGNDATDSDAGVTGKTGTYTVVSGETNNTIDAGFLPIDLELTKAVDNATPMVGANVVFTLTVSNNNAAPGASTATGVVVKDVLPAGMTYVSDNGGGAYNSGTGVWTVGTLAPGASKTLTITATVTTTGTKTNYAQVTAANQLDVDSQPNNNPGPTPTQDDEAAVSLTPGNPAPCITLEKTVRKAAGDPSVESVTIEPYDAVIYSYKVCNCGGTTVTNIVVTDDNGTPSETADDFTVGTIPSLAPGTCTTLEKTVIPVVSTTAVVNGNTVPAGAVVVVTTLVNGDVKVTYFQDFGINDNTYGTGSIGWTLTGHKFGDLTGSDKLQFRLFANDGSVAMDLYMDCITQGSSVTVPGTGQVINYPSGYGTMGPFGGEGSIITGNPNHVVTFSTSISDNLNNALNLPKKATLLVDSPTSLVSGNVVIDMAKAPGGWEHINTYSVTISAAAFTAGGGFAGVAIPDQHNSPNKLGGPHGFVTKPKSSTVINTATAKSGTLVATDTATVNIFVPPPVPAPWTSADIGAVAASGSAASTTGTSFTIAGSGADIGGKGGKDEFHYVYQQANGDCTIVAKVLTVQNTNSAAKAGVMIRNSLADNAIMANLAVTPGSGLIFSYRTAAGGAVTTTTKTGVTAPEWLKIQRVGNVFTASYSSDGVTWTVLKTQNITMGAAPYIGLSVTSKKDGTLCTSTFDNVTATP